MLLCRHLSGITWQQMWISCFFGKLRVYDINWKMISLFKWIQSVHSDNVEFIFCSEVLINTINLSDHNQLVIDYNVPLPNHKSV